MQQVSAALELDRVSYSPLHDISFTVSRGETLMLLGRSGSGKTTLLRLINRLLTPRSGRILVDGRDTATWEIISLRRSIGYAIQNVGLFPHYNVQDNVGLLLRLEGRPRTAITARVYELLDLVGLDRQLATRYPRQLSGGEQHRVGIARALAGDPPLLLFDEPFGDLDPVTRTQLQEDFHRLSKRLQKTVVFVTHDLHEALRLGDRIAFLHEGVLRGIFGRDQLESSRDSEVQKYLAAFRDAQQRIES